jgi:hypothetical protein
MFSSSMGRYSIGSILDIVDQNRQRPWTGSAAVPLVASRLKPEPLVNFLYMGSLFRFRKTRSRLLTYA